MSKEWPGGQPQTKHEKYDEKVFFPFPFLSHSFFFSIFFCKMTISYTFTYAPCMAGSKTTFSLNFIAKDIWERTGRFLLYFTVESK